MPRNINGRSAPDVRARIKTIQKWVRERRTQVWMAQQLSISRQALWQFMTRHGVGGKGKTDAYFLTAEKVRRPRRKK